MLRGLGWFALGNALLFKLITARYWWAVLEPPADGYARAYRLLADLVHWPLLALGLVALPVTLLTLVVPRRWMVTAAAVVVGAASCWVMLLDAVVFANYRMHLGVYVWGLLLGGAAGENLTLSANTFITGAVALVGGLLIEAGLLAGSRALAARKNARRWSRGVWIAWAAGFFALNGWYAWADANYRLHVTQEAANFPFYKPLTAKRALRKLGLTEAGAGEVSQAVPKVAKALYYPQAPLVCPDGPGLNVLLVVIDAWRADQLDAEVTPHIASLIPESLRFTQHISGGNVTRFGIFSIFYGLSGNYWWPVLDHQTPPVLMTELRRRGYDLAIEASAPLVSPEFDRTVFAGIEGLRLRTPGEHASERDRRVTGEMVAFLKDPARQHRPFFGFLWLDAVHAYDIPPDAPLKFEPSWAEVDHMALGPDFDPKPYLNRYKNALHFADDQVGQVLDALRAANLADDTLLIVTSDHGEEFNDNGKNYWGHNGNFSPVQVHVPLLVRAPGWERGSVHYLTTHNDLAPTMLSDALGCTTAPAVYSLGLPLRDRDGRRDYVAVVDYNDTGIYEPDRITVFSPFGGFPVYSHHYDRLEAAARMDVVRAVTDDMLRFSRPPAK